MLTLLIININIRVGVSLVNIGSQINLVYSMLKLAMTPSSFKIKNLLITYDAKVGRADAPGSFLTPFLIKVKNMHVSYTC